MNQIVTVALSIGYGSEYFEEDTGYTVEEWAGLDADDRAVIMRDIYESVISDNLDGNYWEGGKDEY